MIITVDGFVNLGAAAGAAGYQGTNRTRFLSIINDNAETVYIHLTNSGDDAPATSTDGVPIGQGAPAIDFNITDASADIGLMWLYSANPVDVKVNAIGESQ